MLPVIFLGLATSGRRHALPDSIDVCSYSITTLVIGAVLEQGIIAIVVEDCGIIEGLKRGWMVVKSNFWNIVLMGILLGLITGSWLHHQPAILLAFLPMIVPAMQSVTSVVFDFAAFQAPLMLSIGLCCLIYPFILVANGILVAYGQSAWTLTYLRLTRKAKALEATTGSNGCSSSNGRRCISK